MVGHLIAGRGRLGGVAGNLCIGGGLQGGSQGACGGLEGCRDHLACAIR